MDVCLVERRENKFLTINVNCNKAACVKAIVCVKIPSDMPLIQSAIKKVRKDKKRTALNQKREDGLKKFLKEARKNPNAKNLTAIFSSLDKAVKVNLIHANKAARLKSRLSKLAVTKKS